MVGQRDATVRHTEMFPVSRFEIHQLLLSPARLADRVHAGGLDMPQYVGRSVERQMARVFERFDDPVSGSGGDRLHCGTRRDRISAHGARDRDPEAHRCEKSDPVLL